MSRPPQRTQLIRLADVTLVLVLMVGGVVGNAGCAGAGPASPPSNGSPATAPARPPGPEVVAMPDLVGLNAAVAVDQLKKLGFARHRIRLSTKDEGAWFVVAPHNWTVSEQSQAPNAGITNDSVVVLTCTKQ